MSIQSQIGTFNDDSTDLTEHIPEKPDESELSELIAPNCLYDFDVEDVDRIQELRQDIRDTLYADDTVKAWSHILGDHITCGNHKIADEVAIYNAGGAASDCPNLGTKHCQVAEEDCYAVRTEDFRLQSLSARRRELIIWDHLDAVTFSRAFRAWHERKRNEVTALRLNESGDFRSRHDILKADGIARRISDIVDVYTYSASDYLPWNLTNDLVVNRSNDRSDFGHRRFHVVESKEEIPDVGLQCPHDLSDGDIKCGDCRLCIDEDAPRVYVVNFYSEQAE